jgi:hypothetical protein
MPKSMILCRRDGTARPVFGPYGSAFPYNNLGAKEIGGAGGPRIPISQTARQEACRGKKPLATIRLSV